MNADQKKKKKKKVKTTEESREELQTESEAAVAVAKEISTHIYTEAHLSQLSASTLKEGLERVGGSFLSSLFGMFFVAVFCQPLIDCFQLVSVIIIVLSKSISVDWMVSIYLVNKLWLCRSSTAVGRWRYNKLSVGKKNSESYQSIVNILCVSADPTWGANMSHRHAHGSLSEIVLQCLMPACQTLD